MEPIGSVVGRPNNFKLEPLTKMFIDQRISSHAILSLIISGKFCILVYSLIILINFLVALI